MELKDCLENYSSKDYIRLHMPGHKGKNEYIGNIVGNICRYDVTEVPETDDLYNPHGAIKKLQEKIASVYGAEKSFLLVNGATSGVLAAMLSSTKPGDTVLVQRNSHVSVYNAAVLGDLKIEYLVPDFSQKLGIPKGVSPDEIERRLTKNKNIKAVILTNPSYYGICSDIEKISIITKKLGVLLIVDEAHGAHLIFSDMLPLSGVQTKADIVIQSFHKTLPALNQTAVLHINSKTVDSERVLSCIRLVQTASPSFLLMLSAETAMEYMLSDGRKKMEGLLHCLKKNMSPDFGGNLYINERIIKEENISAYDMTKVIVDFSSVGISGTEAQKILREKYNIQVEMSDLRYINAYITVCDTIEELEYFFRCIKKIKDSYPSKEQEKQNIEISSDLPAAFLGLRDAFNRKKQNTKLEDAAGKISGGFIIPYPPGIPLICPGEMINENYCVYIKKLTDTGITVRGVSEGYVKTILM